MWGPYSRTPPNSTSVQRLPPPNTADHLKSQKNVNGKANFLFCYYVAMPIWGTDQTVILPVWLKQHDLFSACSPFTVGFQIPPPFRQFKDRGYWDEWTYVLKYANTKICDAHTKICDEHIKVFDELTDNNLMFRPRHCVGTGPSPHSSSYPQRGYDG